MSIQSVSIRATQSAEIEAKPSRSLEVPSIALTQSGPTANFAPQAFASHAKQSPPRRFISSDSALTGPNCKQVKIVEPENTLALEI
jgi:hypothetical protein